MTLIEEQKKTIRNKIFDIKSKRQEEEKIKKEIVEKAFISFYDEFVTDLLNKNQLINNGRIEFEIKPEFKNQYLIFFNDIKKDFEEKGWSLIINPKPYRDDNLKNILYIEIKEENNGKIFL